MTDYLNKIQDIPIEPENLVKTREKLVEMRKGFSNKFEEVYGKRNMYDDLKNNIFFTFKDSLDAIWKEKVEKFGQIIEERKASKYWKKEFRDVSEGKICDYVSMKLDDSEPYVCTLTRRECVASDGGELQFEFVDCPAYNIPKRLATEIQKVWNKKEQIKTYPI